MTLFAIAFKARVDEEVGDGYTIAQIATRLETHGYSIHDWVEGKRAPAPKRHAAIARFMRIKVEKLKELLP
jgi:transposase